MRALGLLHWPQTHIRCEYWAEEVILGASRSCLLQSRSGSPTFLLP